MTENFESTEMGYGTGAPGAAVPVGSNPVRATPATATETSDRSFSPPRPGVDDLSAYNVVPYTAPTPIAPPALAAQPPSVADSLPQGGSVGPVGGGTRGLVTSIATMANAILRGAMKGRELRQQKQAAAANNLISGLTSLSQNANNDVLDRAQNPAISAILTRQLQDPNYQPSAEEQKTLQPYTDALQRSNAAWAALNQVQNKALLGGDGSGGGGSHKSKKKKSDTGGGDSGDNPIVLAMSKDPNEKLRGMVMLSNRLGNPVQYQVRSMLTQQAQAARQPAALDARDEARYRDLLAKPERTADEESEMKRLYTKRETLREYQNAGNPSMTRGNWENVPGTLNGHPAVFQHDKYRGVYRDSEGRETLGLPNGFMPTQRGAAAEKPLQTMVRSKQSPTGFAKVEWGTNPDGSNRVVRWAPVTPSRFYQGTTTSGTSTDSYGVTTTSAHTTKPLIGDEVDLTGAAKDVSLDTAGTSTVPASSAPSAAATVPSASGTGGEGAVTPTPKKQAPAPHTVTHATPHVAAPATTSATAASTTPTAALDDSGHIPARAANPNLVALANQIMDGADVNKLRAPSRDIGAAMNLARKYGWGGQGMWTPREKMQVDQSRQLINSMSADPAQMAAFDANPVKRALMASAIKTSIEKGGSWSSLWATLRNQGLNDSEIKFVENMRNLIGRVQGLAQLTRGSGRPTEQSVTRMIAELPDLTLARTPEQARHAFERIQEEMDIAMPRESATGHGHTAAPAQGHSTGSTVSLREAMKLPAMRGKSAAEVRKLIEAQGHEVVE